MLRNYSRIAVVILWTCTFAVAIFDPSWSALWPSLIAITTVFLLNKALVGLLAGAASGILLLHNGNPFSAFVAFFSEHLIPALQSSWNISILIFTLLLGGFVSVIEKGGGIRAILNVLLRKGQCLSKTLQWSAFGLGLLCFFDGLANSLLVGKSLSGPARRVGVSGEKMAYIVDSTSSAVACVAIISTWIAYQLSMIREGAQLAGLTHDIRPFQLFLHSIPYNFYCWFTLILLAIVIWRDWNIGPMRKFQNRTRDDGPTKQNPPEISISQETGRAQNAIIPLAVLIISLLFGLYLDGSKGKLLPLSLERISEAYGRADAALVMLCSSALACLVAVSLNTTAIRKQKQKVGDVFMDGVQHLFAPILILISAWVFSSTLKQLDTVSVLASLLEGNFPLWLFPMMVFIMGALLSFTTGTSWGTMGVLMPLALPVAIQLSPDLSSLPVVGTIAAVFSGAVFGDHCSPLSDTTIVSSIACEVEPVDHVKTQLPYAMIAATVAILVGFLPTSLGFPVVFSWLIGTSVLLSLPFIFREKQKVLEVK